MDKKKLARMEMLRKMSKSKPSEDLPSKLEEKLAPKRLSKVTVVAKDKEGLEKGLSKAQQILKAKLGEKLGLEDEDEEETEDEGYSCPECEDVGCKMCEEE